MRQNCWEFKNCGRAPGGPKVSELGVCPATTDTTYDGKNGGRNDGRFCWKVAGTLCGGEVQGSWAAKSMNCVSCDFFRCVRGEQEDFAA